MLRPGHCCLSGGPSPTVSSGVPLVRLGVVLALLGGALAPAGATPPDPAGDVLRIEQARASKDSLLKYGSDSPLPAPERAGFGGLAYYPFDPRYRLAGDLQIYGRQRLIEIPATGGATTTVERFGRFVATFEGMTFSLEVYRSPEVDQLSVYFTDQTNGSQTYGGGRYAPVRALGEGRYLVDFNEAYNPYCAYNHDYVCPLPPPQNRLSFAVRAGEMAYGPHLAR
ncbi:MAG: DUF1684 domain-containing protein [Gemmatimonadota bacterium]